MRSDVDQGASIEVYLRILGSAQVLRYGKTAASTRRSAYSRKSVFGGVRAMERNAMDREKA